MEGPELVDVQGTPGKIRGSLWEPLVLKNKTLPNLKIVLGVIIGVLGANCEMRLKIIS